MQSKAVKHVCGDTAKHYWCADLHEGHTAAVQVGHRHAQQLTPAVQVPHSNLAQATGRKDIAVVMWEGHVVHAAGWRGLQHLCLQLLALHAPLRLVCDAENKITW